MKDHEIAKKVNELRYIAVRFGRSQQLRQRICHAIVDDLKRIRALELRVHGLLTGKPVAPKEEPITVQELIASVEAGEKWAVGDAATPTDAELLAIAAQHIEWVLPQHALFYDAALISFARALLAAPNHPDKEHND